MVQGGNKGHHRTSHSVPRMGGSMKDDGQTLQARKTFGIIPTLNQSVKDTVRKEQARQLKKSKVKVSEADKFMQSAAGKSMPESPTSMKMKNTFLL